MTRQARATGTRADGTSPARPARGRILLVALALAAAACDDPGVHVFSAQVYDTAGQCVDTSSTALDVINGATTGDHCAPACLVQSPQVYVSTQCGPYPQGYTVEAADAATDAADPCTAALAAFTAGTTCGAGDDGGGDGAADSGTDDAAPPDAGADAAGDH